MKTMIILTIFILLFSALSIVGCTAVKQAGNELGVCMDKCTSLCSVLKNNSLDMGGYNNIQLSKVSGSMTVSCSCPC
jgi:hypothetical protein